MQVMQGAYQRIGGRVWLVITDSRKPPPPPPPPPPPYPPPPFRLAIEFTVRHDLDHAQWPVLAQPCVAQPEDQCTGWVLLCSLAYLTRPVACFVW